MMFKTVVFMELSCIHCAQKSLMNIFDVYQETTWICSSCQKANKVFIKEDFRTQKNKILDFVGKVQDVANLALNSGIHYKEDSVKNDPGGK
jgi:hypothetical protein